MALPELEISTPATVADACRYLEAGAAEAIAGGTDLLPALKGGLKRPDRLVDLSESPASTGSITPHEAA